jgi:hypothetical protein
MRLLLFLLLLSLTLMLSCVTGRVSTISHNVLPTGSKFIIIESDAFSVTSKQIKNMIANKMVNLGYIEATSEQEADAVILYKYNVGSGSTEVSISSRRDFIWGGQKVQSDSETVYPRFFQIAIVDLKRSKLPDQLELIWHGEVYSKGSSANILSVAQEFIDALFENYNKSVTNKHFTK